VEPEIPISDLFPAITEEIPIQNGIGGKFGENGQNEGIF
jgi:hypothetical protein